MKPIRIQIKGPMCTSKQHTFGLVQTPAALGPHLAHARNARHNRVFKEIKLLATLAEEEVDLIVIPRWAAGLETLAQIRRAHKGWVYAPDTANTNRSGAYSSLPPSSIPLTLAEERSSPPTPALPSNPPVLNALTI